MNKLLNTSFERVIHALVPGFVRGPILVKWFQALAYPLVYIRERLAEYRLKTNKRMIVTGQSLVLVNYLNDLYDPSERRIDIQDTGLVKQEYIFNIVEGIDEVYGYNLGEEATQLHYVSNITEMDAITDYQVLLPASVFTTQKESVREVVSAYNILNRTFFIQNLEA